MGDYDDSDDYDDYDLAMRPCNDDCFFCPFYPCDDSREREGYDEEGEQ